MATEFDGLPPAPDREALLDELARCFVQAAVTRLLKEQREAAEGRCSTSEVQRKQPKSRQKSAALAAKIPRTRRRRTDITMRAGVKCKAVGVT